MSIRHKLLKGPLGFGAAPLGNMFRNIPEDEAAATVDSAWRQGTRYYDTAPFYGAGLSEIRLGKALAKHGRDEFVLSSKVGRLILNEVETGARDFGEKGGLFEFGRPNRIVYDYSGDGALRSIEDSLKRLGVNVILDDFGTGNSSLNGLRQLQVEAVKIDRSMVSGMLVDRGAAESVDLILMVAHKLKLRVIAEGIETAKQLDHLQQSGCELGQGYFFSAPLEAKLAEQLLRQRGSITDRTFEISFVAAGAEAYVFTFG